MVKILAVALWVFLICMRVFSCFVLEVSKVRRPLRCLAFVFEGELSHIPIECKLSPSYSFLYNLFFCRILSGQPWRIYVYMYTRSVHIHVYPFFSFSVCRFLWVWLYRLLIRGDSRWNLSSGTRSYHTTPSPGVCIRPIAAESKPTFNFICFFFISFIYLFIEYISCCFVVLVDFYFYAIKRTFLSASQRIE